MIASVHAMTEAGDDRALDDLWRLMGGSSEKALPRAKKAALVANLIHKNCGKGELYSAERTTMDQLARTVGVDPTRFPRVEPLEDAIVEAIGRRIEEKLKAMTEGAATILRGRGETHERRGANPSHPSSV